MQPQRIVITTLIATIASLTIGDIPLILNLPSRHLNLQVLAQTVNANKAEAADELFQQGLDQFNHSQFEAAIKFWQQALTIYQEIKNRPRERMTLGNLGAAYFYLSDYTKTIDYEEQSLAIAREINDRKGEANAIGIIGNG